MRWWIIVGKYNVIFIPGKHPVRPKPPEKEEISIEKKLKLLEAEIANLKLGNKNISNKLNDMQDRIDKIPIQKS